MQGITKPLAEVNDKNRVNLLNAAILIPLALWSSHLDQSLG